MAVSKIDVVDRFFNDNGALLAGGKVRTCIAGTNTPLATYTDNTAATAHANPIILDGSGNTQIWFREGFSYKVTFTDANDVSVGEDIDGLVIGDSTATAAAAAYIVSFEHLLAIPTTSEIIGLHVFAEAVTFAINFAGAYGKCLTNPTASFVVTVKKNGSTCGTVTVSTGGAFTFATSGAAQIGFAIGDYMTLHAPSSVDASILNIGVSFLAGLA